MNTVLTHTKPTAGGELSLALRDFVVWNEATSSAAPDEIWGHYWAHLRPILYAVTPSVLALRVHILWRPRVAQALCRTALAHLILDPWPSLSDGSEEARLWESALYCSARGVADWEKQFWFDSPAAEWNYWGARHRLADLHRRAARTDAGAVENYIAVFTGPAARGFSGDGPGGEHAPEQLIERGAHIQNADALTSDELRTRYGLCLRLALQRFPALWVEASLRAARTRRIREQEHRDREIARAREAEMQAAREAEAREAEAREQTAPETKTTLRSARLRFVQEIQSEEQAREADSAVRDAALIGQLTPPEQVTVSPTSPKKRGRKPKRQNVEATPSTVAPLPDIDEDAAKFAF